MAPSRIPRPLTIAVLAACAGVGAYGTFGTSTRNGLFASIMRASGRHVKERRFPGGPGPYKTSYTGIAPLDDQLVVLVTFFTFIIDGPQTWDITLTTWYLMVQFAAGWSLVALEGLRAGNKASALGWTALLGACIQNASYTVSVPVYLILHTIFSPVTNRSNNLAADLAVDAEHLACLPLSNIISFFIPAVMMILPSPSITSPAAHYTWDVVWQAFPLWHVLCQWTLKRVLPSPSSNTAKSKPRRYLDSASYAYSYIILIAVFSQTALLAVAFAPASLVPDAWQPLFSQVGFQSAFVPYFPWASPTADATAAVITADGKAELVKLFLQWDIYCGGTAILVWALYSYQGVALADVAFWTVLGGPVAAAAIILWDRDAAVVEGALDEAKKTA